MNRFLRALRLVVSIAMILLVGGAFVGGGKTGGVLGPVVQSTQIVPNVLRLSAGAGAGAAAALGAILVLTLVFGRVYCSCLCPLGIALDAVRFAARRIPYLRRFQDRRRDAGGAGREALRTGILAATVLTSVSGSLVLLNLLDPYSVFGRFTAGIAVPALDLGRVGVARLLEKADLFFLSGWLNRPFLLGAGVAAAVLFTVPALLAAFRGRLYCTAVCPVGAALGLVSRFSPVRIRTAANPCTACGRCVRRCRAECISVEKGGTPVIDGSSCTLCLDCITVCPEGALRYGFPKGVAAPAGEPEAVASPVPALPTGLCRRGFLAAGGAAAAGLAAYPLRAPAARFLRIAEPTPVTPPGSLGLAHFAEHCTGCHLCVTACPTGVLRPSNREYGAKGILQPRMDYLHGYCDYDCTTCSGVCPNDAIRPIAIEDKQLVRIGLVTLYKRRCVVYLRGEECGACAELCPTHAAYTVERDGILYPETDDSLCIGCGACEFACPQFPKAIEVAARVVHDTAQPPFSSVMPGGDDEGPMIQFGGDDGGEFPF